MSLVKKCPDAYKEQHGVYLILDAFIREKMLRRLFSLRKSKLEEKEGETGEQTQTQKENIDPNAQVEEDERTGSTATVEQDKLVISSIGTNMDEFQEETNTQESSNYVSTDEENISEKLSPKLTEEQHISELSTAFEGIVVSTPKAESDMKACDSIQVEVANSDESERPTSAEESSKDESGIEQDLESTDDSAVMKTPNNNVDSFPNSSDQVSGTEINSEMHSIPLVPINLRSHLKRNERIKKFDRIPKRTPARGDSDVPIEKCPSFISSMRKEGSVQRVRYSQRLPVAPQTPRRARRSKAPELFGDLIMKDRTTSRTRHWSPVRKGVLKNPGGSKFAASGDKFGNALRKQKTTTVKGHSRMNSLSSDSGVSESDNSSGEEQKRMPVRKIFSNQQSLRKKIDDLNGMLETMQEQKSELLAVLGIIEDWSNTLRHVDRTNLGVPYIRAVKQLLGKQRAVLVNKKSDFNRTVTKLKESDVPYLEELCNLTMQLKKEVTYVARDQRKYSARSVENIRQLQGKLIGTCSAILAVYYEH